MRPFRRSDASPPRTTREVCERSAACRGADPVPRSPGLTRPFPATKTSAPDCPVRMSVVELAVSALQTRAFHIVVFATRRDATPRPSTRHRKAADRDAQYGNGRCKNASVIAFTIMYPRTDGSTFDMDYYPSSHMPMLAECLGDSCRGWGAAAIAEG